MKPVVYTKPDSVSDRKTLYPAIEPYRTEYLPVGDGHELYFEECGNRDGIPVIFMHGGPGSSADINDRRYFDPKIYRIILMDQRGAGRSKPYASLHENTTWKLVSDFEKLRAHLQIERWLVFGGSWGSTIALTYSIQHPEPVLGLVLRGIFMIRKQEIHWFYQSGADAIYPDAWEEYRDAIPANERGDFVRAYYQRLTNPDPAVQLKFAHPWSRWEIACSKLYTPHESVTATVTDEFAVRFARIEAHYFINQGFFESDGWILKNVDRIRHIPAVIVQGRYDIVCPMTSAWDLHRAWPEAELQIIHDAGHSRSEPGIMDALIRATDRFADSGGEMFKL
jgi:proline iminopeptidase